MRNHFTAIVFLLATPVGVASAQTPFDPHVKFVKGETQHISMALGQTIDQTVNDSKRHTVQTVNLELTLAVIDVDSEGTAKIEVRFESVALHAETPDGPADYVSTDPPGQVPVSARGLAAVVGQSYGAFIDSHGAIKQVTGLASLLDTVMSKFNIPEGVGRMAIEKTLRQEFDEKNLVQYLQNLFAPLPDRPVSIGDNWVRMAQVNLGVPLKVQSTYTLLSQTANTASIEVTGRSATAKDATLEVGAFKLNYDLQGDQNGTLQISQSTGQTQSSEISQHLSGSVTLRGLNSDPQTSSVTVESTIKMERK